MQQQRAFTLVELSIVLVILGLLTGGILAGKSLIRASELRAVGTEKSKLFTAYYAFKDKYFAYPGDMANAYDVWGATCGTNATTISAGCNGNGNGIVSVVNGEHVKAWEHLALAGMIEGTFDGTGGSYDATHVILTTANTYPSKLGPGRWDLTDDPNNMSGTVPTSGQYLTLGTVDNANYYLISALPMTATESWNIDTKLDDGRGTTGLMRGDSGGDCTDDGANDPYGLSSRADVAVDCKYYFILRQ